MKVFVTLRGQEYEVEVGNGEPGLRTVRLPGGETVTVDLHAMPGGFHALIGGRSFDVALGAGPEGTQIARGMTRAEPRVETERDRAKRARTGGGASTAEVRAPMPGRIVAVHVKPGDEVEPGAPLVVVEAMKMENEIRSPRKGRVAEVPVQMGASVEGKALLVRFE